MISINEVVALLAIAICVLGLVIWLVDYLHARREARLNNHIRNINVTHAMVVDAYTAEVNRKNAQINGPHKTLDKMAMKARRTGADVRDALAHGILAMENEALQEALRLAKAELCKAKKAKRDEEPA